MVTEQRLDPVESEWREGEGQDGPSQQKDGEIYLSIARNAKDNWYTIHSSSVMRQTLQHISLTMPATPFSPQVQQQFIGL